MTQVYTDEYRGAAVDYCERYEWSVIPLRGKVPTGPWAQYQERRPTMEEIERLEWPGVGIVTGKVSGIVVLDADSEEAVEKLRRLGHPPTPMAKTARGIHVYLKHPGGELPTRIGLGDGLDLKGDRGYVVAPPSRHPSGAIYEWIISPEEAALADCPAWLMERIRLRGRRMAPQDVGEVIKNGARNKTLFSIAGTLRRRGLDEAAIFAALLGVNETKCQTPLPQDEVRRIAASAARYAPAELQQQPTTTPGSFRLTDLGNAERLVARHGHDLRYCYLWAKWLVCDGKRWVVDAAGEVERRAIETVRSIYAEAANATDSDEAKRIARHAASSESRSRIEAMVALARSMAGITVQPDELDSDPWLLNVENGTVDLRTGELRNHDRADLITKIAPVEYDPNAGAPRFARFLREVLVEDDVIDFVRRFAGYSLTGSTREQAFAILHGTGKNGKSTLVELLRDALGDYAANTDTETVLRKRYSGVSNDVAALKGARFVSAAEVEQGRALAESKVKNLTGSDTVTARFLFAEPFDFRPEFKLWLSTNNKPVIHGTDDAIWGRIKLIPFTRRFEGAQADAELPEKLRAELPGVLVWMVRGCLEWLRDGLGEPEAVRKATGDYRTEMDSLAAFVEDECVVRPDAWCKFADLYAAYLRWCEDSNEAAEKKRQFGMRLTERGFEKAAGTGNVKIRKGIALRHDPGHDPSKVTDPDPEDGPEERETPPDAGTIGNRVTDRAENSDSRNTCKTADSGERVADSYRKSKTLAENPPRREGFENTVTKGNSVTPGPENDPVKPLNEALTSDEVQRERGLVREGMKPEIARREVLSKRRKT